MKVDILQLKKKNRLGRVKKQLPKNTPKPNEKLLEPGSLVFSMPNEVTSLIDFINGGNGQKVQIGNNLRVQIVLLLE